MATLVSNRPDHPWYQRRYHVRLPRMAESRAYLDAAFLPGAIIPIPVGWNFGMAVGTRASDGVAGYVSLLQSSTLYCGQMNPTTFAGKVIRTLYVSTTNTALIQLDDPAAQLPGIGTVTLTAQGFGGSVAMLWTGGVTRYQVTAQTAFGDFMRANIGNVIGVTLVGSALLRFPPPYPWEPLDSAALNEWVDENDIDVPGNWFSLSLTAKKAYLVINYGEPAP